jgi:signal transduction histidine kinase
MEARHCLLVVDDEPEVVQSLQDLLRFDYRVLGANRASEGLRILEREPVQIVMTDQRMPEMSGVEFLGQLRESHPDVVRLLFTGFADVHTVVDAVNQGNVFRYVTKPWDPGELQSVLRQAAERYDLLAERRRLNEELQEKNRALEKLNASLREANDLKVSFIRVASHELRTPLTIVLGLSELLRAGDCDKETVRSTVNQIHQGAERLTHIADEIGQMLLAGNFDRPLARSETVLEDLLWGAASTVAPFVTRRRQTLAVKVSPDLGSLTIESHKIRDALTHLLLNAIKFTPDNGIIRLSGSRRPDQSVEIRVSDTGVGIAPDALKHVFDPFFTDFDVTNHTSGVFEFRRHGLGLGLTLVKGFVEMHGGTVEATSEVGKGTTFIIWLPR